MMDRARKSRYFCNRSIEPGEHYAVYYKSIATFPIRGYDGKDVLGFLSVEPRSSGRFSVELRPIMQGYSRRLHACVSALKEARRDAEAAERRRKAKVKK